MQIPFKTRWCIRVTLEIVVWIFNTYDNNLEIKNVFEGRVVNDVLINISPSNISHLCFSLLLAAASINKLICSFTSNASFLKFCRIRKPTTFWAQTVLACLWKHWYWQNNSKQNEQNKTNSKNNNNNKLLVECTHTVAGRLSFSTYIVIIASNIVYLLWAEVLEWTETQVLLPASLPQKRGEGGGVRETTWYE